jgi:phosphate transport system substrate-binding protein
MLLFREHGNERIGAGLRDFVTWALADGQDMAADLGYIPMPKAVVERVRAEIPNIR